MPLQPKRAPWVAAGVIVGATLLPAWLLLERNKTREVSFPLGIVGHGHPDRITQKTIDAYLGTGYSVVNADTVDGQENGRDTLKLVTLRVPAHVPAADIAARLRAIPGATDVVVPEVLYSSLDEARAAFKDQDKLRSKYQASRKKMDEEMAKEDAEAEKRQPKMRRDPGRDELEKKD